MNRLMEFFTSPGAKGAIEDAAPMQRVISPDAYSSGKETSESMVALPVDEMSGFVVKAKKSRLDSLLDSVVRASGSEPVFLLIVAGLLAWAFLGIPFGASDEWAIIISNVQAIISYIYDSLLMRQQLNEYEKVMRVSAILRSRAYSHQRMLRQILASGRYTISTPAALVDLNQAGFAADLPVENWLGKISTITSKILGHIVTVLLYWVCIGIWLGFGPSEGWSDEWQLYINSATSALMVLIFAFLANIHERHGDYSNRCLDSLFRVDSSVEAKLRTLSGDNAPNPTVIIPAPTMNKIQRAIFYYSDLVGTLTGVAILIIVIVVWVAIGPIMSFSSNWWLLIGTYAGLIGLNDGFVLRNVQFQLNSYEDAAFAEANLQDVGLFDDIRVPDPAIDQVQDNSINYRVSAKIGVICSHEITVVLGVLLIIGLLIGASILKWTITGQLLCNIPPTIIESFFMMILITGHNLNELRRRERLQSMYLRRRRLLAYVDLLVAQDPVDSPINAQTVE